jgi:hypothetical protein
MRLLFVFPLAILMLAAADKPADKPVDKPADKKKDAKLAARPAAPPVKPLEIPAGAVETVPGSYRWTDKEGTVWIYRRTPFGIQRYDEKYESVANPKPNVDAIKVTEDGETLRFERTGPFGVQRWQRNKSELTDVERAAWEKSRAAAKQD